MLKKKNKTKQKPTKVIYIQIGYLRKKDRMLELAKLGIKEGNH